MKTLYQRNQKTELNRIGKAKKRKISNLVRALTIIGVITGGVVSYIERKNLTDFIPLKVNSIGQTIENKCNRLDEQAYKILKPIFDKSYQDCSERYWNVASKLGKDEEIYELMKEEGWDNMIIAKAYKRYCENK